MLYYMFNKPMGCVTARSDAVHRTVMDYFPPQLAEQLHPVGRLDKDTCGLLILTDDGMLDVSIMQPKKHISKTYFFYAIGSVNNEKAALLEQGVPLVGFTTDRAKFRLIKRFRIAELEAFMPEKRRMRYMKNPDGPAFAAELTISEGKKHEVKRMLEAVGCRIFYLRRECIGKLRLDPRLEQGQFRPLTDEEVAMLKSNAEI
ncbi:pseudouridine synthase [Ruminococcus sp.]|uniref:pseudouridine synthase n=1 Tax=Ruminococcus sp. TaxID=41978 RepID=UPI0025E3AC58|nr:pseudouridine synthase [Ruminococcus sp.]MBQ6252163.1 pseudouridine synthase [Ruminococcus sp.]